MFPLAAVGEGVSLLGGIEGLLSGNAEAERQRKAMEAAIQELSRSYAQEENSLTGQGVRGTNAFTGALNDALQSTGRNLGSATAAGGVYNSSATAGALANQAQAGSQALSRYGVGLNELLSRVRGEHAGNLANLRYGMGQNLYNDALRRRDASAGGLSSLLGSIGQANLLGKPNANNMGNAGNGMANSVLPGYGTGGGGVLPNTWELHLENRANDFFPVGIPRRNPYQLQYGQQVA